MKSKHYLSLLFLLYFSFIYTIWFLSFLPTFEGILVTFFCLYPLFSGIINNRIYITGEGGYGRDVVRVSELLMVLILAIPSFLLVIALLIYLLDTLISISPIWLMPFTIYILKLSLIFPISGIILVVTYIIFLGIIPLFIESLQSFIKENKSLKNKNNEPDRFNDSSSDSDFNFSILDINLDQRNMEAKVISNLINEYLSIQFCSDNLVVPIALNPNLPPTPTTLTIAFGDFILLESIGTFTFIKDRLKDGNDFQLYFSKKSPDEIKKILSELSD